MASASLWGRMPRACSSTSPWPRWFPWPATSSSALAAGSFIGFGAILSIVLTVGIDASGIARLLLGLGFAAGFTLVILSGSALFTEADVLLPEMFLSRRVRTSGCCIGSMPVGRGFTWCYEENAYAGLSHL